MMSLVAKNYRKVAAGETIQLFKSHRPDYRDGEQRRDFVYVKDCVAAMLWLWRHGRDNGIYNLGTGEARNFLDLMNALRAPSGVRPHIDVILNTPRSRAAMREEGSMQQTSHWVGTWTAAPAPAEGVVGFNNHTLRMMPRISLGGGRFRVRISNTYGARPLTIGAGRIGLRGNGPAIVP